MGLTAEFQGPEPPLPFLWGSTTSFEGEKVEFHVGTRVTEMQR